jgi:hypothetical protein
VISGFHAVEKPIFAGGQKTALTYHSNTGIVAAHSMEAAIALIKRSPIGFQLPSRKLLYKRTAPGLTASPGDHLPMTATEILETQRRVLPLRALGRSIAGPKNIAVRFPSNCLS